MSLLMPRVRGLLQPVLAYVGLVPEALDFVLDSMQSQFAGR